MRHQTLPKAGPAGARGFTITEMVIVLAVLVILAAIAIPQYIGARRAYKEKTVSEYMKSVGSAANDYRTASGTKSFPATLAALLAPSPGQSRPPLDPPDQVVDDSTVVVGGWRVALVASGANHFECRATPPSGGRRYAVFEDGTARYTDDGTPPTRNSPAVK